MQKEACQNKQWENNHPSQDLKAQHRNTKFDIDSQKWETRIVHDWQADRSSTSLHHPVNQWTKSSLEVRPYLLARRLKLFSESWLILLWGWFWTWLILWLDFFGDWVDLVLTSLCFCWNHKLACSSLCFNSCGCIGLVDNLFAFVVRGCHNMSPDSPPPPNSQDTASFSNFLLECFV